MEYHHTFGLVEFLAQARYEFKKANRGVNPKAFLVHPEHYIELRADERCKHGTGILHVDFMTGKMYLMGIEVREDLNADTPILVTPELELEVI